MKILKYVLPLLVLSFLVIAPVCAAITQPTEMNATVNEPTGMANLNNVGVDSLTKAVLNIRNWFAGIVLIIAVGVILIGAFLYMTSGGDSTKTGAARGWSGYGWFENFFGHDAIAIIIMLLIFGIIISFITSADSKEDVSTLRRFGVDFGKLFGGNK